jgi:heterotetrameric sarcosine oxidase delta subunit
MMLVPCPWCGARSDAEFVAGGEAHIERPGPQVDDQRWAEYLHVRRNTKGVHAERWFHAYGCRRWFNVVRNTVTHEILRVYRMGEAPHGALDDTSAQPAVGAGAVRDDASARGLTATGATRE